jgi:hypothetical protein
MLLGDLMFTDFKNFGCGLAIALLALSSLSAVVYHDDVFAGKGNGGGNGGGNAGSDPDTKSASGINPEYYENWLSNHTKE